MPILNLLCFYCRIETINVFGDVTTGALIHGLRNVSEEHGHYQIWIVDDAIERAKESSLKGNRDKEALRRAHIVYFFDIVR